MYKRQPYSHINLYYIWNKTKDWALVHNAALAYKKNALKVLKNKANYRFNIGLASSLSLKPQALASSISLKH